MRRDEGRRRSGDLQVQTSCCFSALCSDSCCPALFRDGGERLVLNAWATSGVWASSASGPPLGSAAFWAHSTASLCRLCSAPHAGPSSQQLQLFPGGPGQAFRRQTNFIGLREESVGVFLCPKSHAELRVSIAGDGRVRRSRREPGVPTAGWRQAAGGLTTLWGAGE